MVLYMANWSPMLLPLQTFTLQMEVIIIGKQFHHLIIFWICWLLRISDICHMDRFKQAGTCIGLKGSASYFYWFASKPWANTGKQGANQGQLRRTRVHSRRINILEPNRGQSRPVGPIRLIRAKWDILGLTDLVQTWPSGPIRNNMILKDLG